MWRVRPAGPSLWAACPHVLLVWGSSSPPTTGWEPPFSPFLRFTQLPLEFVFLPECHLAAL